MRSGLLSTRLDTMADAQDSTTGELFATVPYAAPWTSVEPVLDSSRYFVLRVEGEGGKRAYIGMGFAERGEAFDFQVRWVNVPVSAACAEHVSILSQRLTRAWVQSDAKSTQVSLQSVSKRSSRPAASDPAKPAPPPKDYSLKEGQTFTIKIPGREGKKDASASAPASGAASGGGGGLFSLPPPPPPGGRKR
jgi:hypothetical protein